MVNICVLGCGRISKNHFESIAKIPNARIVGCCDVISERAEMAAKSYNVPYWTTDYEDLLNSCKPELVSICTPSGLHPKHGITAARLGVNVLTEKPMGVKLSSADKLIKSCEENNVKLFVVLQNRLNPSIQMVKQALDSGRFGKIYKIVANVFWTRPQDYYDSASWRGTWELDGGAFCNQASHYVDLVQWFGGPVNSVAAHTATLARNIEAEDTGSAIIVFKSGCIASINVTMLTYPQNFEGSITILGEKGSVRIGGVAANKILHWEFKDWHDSDNEIKSTSTMPGSVYGFGHYPYYEGVIDSLRNNTPPMIDGLEGRKSLEIIEAIYKSSRDREFICFQN